MHFGTKNYLKNNRNHTVKYFLNHDGTATSSNLKLGKFSEQFYLR